VTQAQHKARIRRIIKVWRSRLMLDHIILDIEWDEEPENPDAVASVYCSDLYDQATLRFSAQLIDYNNDELNRVIVHELMHIMFRDYGMAVRSIEVTGSIASDVRMLWHDRCHDAEEAVVDRLANRFVDLGGVVE